MKAARLIGLLAAAMMASPNAAFAGGADGETTPVFERGPRIIHVPRPDAANEDVAYRAAMRTEPVDRNSYEPSRRRHDDVVSTAPRRHVKQPDHRLSGMMPRRRPFNAPQSPAPTGPRRAVLSVPPPGAGGLTPIYPTPKFETKAAADERRVPDTTASFETPPPGYSPPAVPPHDLDRP